MGQYSVWLMLLHLTVFNRQERRGRRGRQAIKSALRKTDTLRQQLVGAVGGRNCGMQIAKGGICYLYSRNFPHSENGAATRRSRGGRNCGMQIGKGGRALVLGVTLPRIPSHFVLRSPARLCINLISSGLKLDWLITIILWEAECFIIFNRQ